MHIYTLYDVYVLLWECMCVYVGVYVCVCVCVCVRGRLDQTANVGVVPCKAWSPSVPD